MNHYLTKALSALGVLLFGAGVAVIPLGFWAFVVLWHPELALLVLLTSFALCLWLGIRYAIRPSQPHYWWRALASVMIFVRRVCGYQFVLGLPGRIGEMRLEHSLRAGMTTAQATEVARNVGGNPSGQSTNEIRIRFVDIYDLCASGGREFTLLFDDDNILRSWKSSPWNEACNSNV